MEYNTLPHQHGNPHNIAELSAQLSQAEAFLPVADFMKQLGDGTRLRIFWLLCHREECVINISALMDMSSPAVSHHLRQLKDGGLIVSHREGKEVYYQVAKSPLCTLLHETIEHMMQIQCPE